jgi:hypothetical protein
MITRKSGSRLKRRDGRVNLELRRGSSVVEQTPEERRVGCSIHPRGTRERLIILYADAFGAVAIELRNFYGEESMLHACFRRVHINLTRE